MMAELIGALIASIYGSFTALRPKTPLFYRIIFFAMLACLMGNVYTLLHGLLWSREIGGFHVGYLGYTGMFFFLHSAYYGAINSLGDGGEAELRKYRLFAGAACIVFLLAAVWLTFLFSKEFWLFIVLVPMCLTLYFAVKHLLLPDVEMGVIRVLRPYNALVIALSVGMMLRLLSPAGSVQETVSGVLSGLLLAVIMPVVRNGVRKWST